MLLGLLYALSGGRGTNAGTPPNGPYTVWLSMTQKTRLHNAREIFYVFFRRSRKKFLSRAAHSSANTPAHTSG